MITILSDIESNIENGSIKLDTLNDLMEPIEDEAEVSEILEYLNNNNINIVETPEEQTVEKNVNGLKQYLKEASQYPLLTKEEEIQFAKEKRYDELVCSNLRLVVHTAKKYINRGLELDDLIQEGNMGLMKASTKFNPDKGFKFSTYATWWIRQSMVNALSTSSKTIRIPVHISSKINTLVKATKKLSDDLGREPNILELVKETGFTEEMINKLKKYNISVVSYDKPCNDDSDTQMIDFIKSDLVSNDCDSIRRESIENILNILSDRDKKIMQLRFGFTDGVVHTLDEIASMYGLTKQGVFQIERKSIRRLSISKEADKIAGFY